MQCLRLPTGLSTVCARRRRAAAQPTAAESLAALDFLCGDTLADTCEADAAWHTGTGVVSRDVEVLLADDEGPRPVALSLPLLSPLSRLLVVTLDLPLGIVFSDSEAGVVVDELTEGSAVDAPVRLRRGDVLRATTAWVSQMTYSAANLLGGGSGAPRWRQVVMMLDFGDAWRGDGVSFGRALAGVQSCRRAGKAGVTLVFERPAASDSE